MEFNIFYYYYLEMPYLKEEEYKYDNMTDIYYYSCRISRNDENINVENESVENGKCGKRKVPKVESGENGKWRKWKMAKMENGETGRHKWKWRNWKW